MTAQYIDNEIQVRVQDELAKILADPRKAIKLYAQALVDAEMEIEAINHKINHDLMPKVEMYQAVMDSTDLHEMSAVAKILNFRNMGRNNLFAYLQNKNILRYNNEPYQQYVNNGNFEIKEESYDKGYGMRIYRKTMVTQKGLEYIRKLLLEDGYELNG